MKIKKIKMELNTLINIGTNYLVLYINENMITFKIFNNTTISEGKGTEENIGQNYVTKEYKVKEDEDCIITIGRSQKCDIMIWMDNDKNNLTFKVPSFERAKGYNFGSTRESFAVYKELSEIAEELEKCRLKNI